eukprot:CAMPEP_0172635408 /NCGR_PEP_ID=MMETSP1068-20121228/199222_1 /TAXON_ID=35684 /ORGANISM="Pseudopedinella elastica, Strain CCMP716" /LENGTH=322 /DNA_ID=CAMNT_0013447613 /DNA_START=111 /DNA_END=1077 /DNA_ORIENTATION=-
MLSQTWRGTATASGPIIDSLPAKTTLAISDANLLIFVHMPKTGGSSVEMSGLFQDRREALGVSYIGGHHRVMDLLASPLNASPCADYFSFAIARHPCNRLRSLWAYYREGLGNSIDLSWVKKHISPAAQRDFSRFVVEMEQPPQKGGVVPWDWRRHLHTQTQVGMLVGFPDHTYHASGELKVLVNQVLGQERWNESARALDKAMNAPKMLAKRAAVRKTRVGVGGKSTPSGHRAIPVAASRVDVVSSLLGQHEKPSAHSHETCAAELKPEAWDALVRMYEVDFCALGYEARRDKQVHETPPPPTLSSLGPAAIEARFKGCCD